MEIIVSIVLSFSRNRWIDSCKEKVIPSKTARASSPGPCDVSKPIKLPRITESECGVLSPAKYGVKISPFDPMGTLSILASDLFALVKVVTLFLIVSVFSLLSLFDGYFHTH